MELLYADLTAKIEPRTYLSVAAPGHWRTIHLSEAYDRPFKGAMVAEVTTDVEFADENLDGFTRLLAAAPDLLSACQNMIGAMRKVYGDLGPSDMIEMLDLEKYLGDEIEEMEQVLATLED